uniref:NUDIX hydrolase n=1 Tax=Segatella hominis TaxID=2518605 RepID=UPI004038A7F4
MTQFYNEHSKVLVSVDCIIFGFNGSQLQLLIGKRQMDPGRGEWSLYGGFVGQNENLEDAANRVILDLTGMKGLYIRQVGAFGRIDRDPGERVISIAYCTLINVKDYDDSLRIRYGLEWVNLNDLPKLYSYHNLMIQNAISQIRRRINNEPLSFKLLPELFTLTQLQHVFETVMGEEIDKRNFRKRIKDIDFIEKTELIDKISSKRGAALYRFNKKAYEQDPYFNLK